MNSQQLVTHFTVENSFDYLLLNSRKGSTMTLDHYELDAGSGFSDIQV